MNKVSYLLLLLFLTSCVSEPSSEVVANFTTELNVSLSQVPTAEGPDLQLIIESIDNFDCNSAYVQSSMYLNGGDLTLDIEDVIIPDECTSGDIAAHGENNIFLAPGEYNFDLDLGNLAHQSGNLLISEEAFVLDIEDLSGVHFNQTEILKIPDNHVWGTIAYPDGENAAVVNFINEIENFVDLNTTVRSGHYGIFEIDDNQEAMVFNNQGLFIIYELKDLELLKERIANFRALFPNVNIELTTSRGEKL